MVGAGAPASQPPRCRMDPNELQSDDDRLREIAAILAAGAPASGAGPRRPGRTPAQILPGILPRIALSFPAKRGSVSTRVDRFRDPQKGAPHGTEHRPRGRRPAAPDASGELRAPLRRGLRREPPPPTTRPGCSNASPGACRPWPRATCPNAPAAAPPSWPTTPTCALTPPQVQRRADAAAGAGPVTGVAAAPRPTTACRRPAPS